MRKILILVSVFLSFSFLLASCSSIPKPTSADDCLVIIKTEYSNSTTYPIMRKYRILLSRGEKPIEIPSVRSSYMAILVREPAVRIIAITSDVNDVSAYGLNSTNKASIALPYEPGAAVVVDFCISQKMTQGDDQYSFVAGYSMRKMEQFERDELAMMLRDSGKIDGWSI